MQNLVFFFRHLKISVDDEPTIHLSSGKTRIRDFGAKGRVYRSRRMVRRSGLDIAEVRALTQRKVVLHNVVRQSLTVADWQACNAEMMEAHGLSLADVNRGLTFLACRLVLVPVVLNLYFMGLFRAFVGIESEREWCALAVLFSAVFIASCIYGVILATRSSAQRYLQESGTLLLGTIGVFLGTWILLGFVPYTKYAPNQGVWAAKAAIASACSSLVLWWCIRRIARPLSKSTETQI